MASGAAAPVAVCARKASIQMSRFVMKRPCCPRPGSPPAALRNRKDGPGSRLVSGDIIPRHCRSQDRAASAGRPRPGAAGPVDPERTGRQIAAFPKIAGTEAEARPMSYEHILVETRGAVGIATLNRPAALNALCAKLISELAEALDRFEADDAVGCIVVTGSDRAFAAGADIKEMQPKTYMDAYLEDFITVGWERVTGCRKPVMAGYALGGGCEMAMMCDFIIAADTARFGQPEINLGALPGGGGTQRLARFIGKSKTMDMCLTGRMMDADEAERSGLVSRVVPADRLLDTAVEIAASIAAKSRPAAMITKECVNRAYEMPLSEGVRYERRMFHSTFATEDQKEGMAAFIEKREPVFKGR